MLSLLEKMHKIGRLLGKARAPLENICYILLVERVYGVVSVKIGSKDELKIIKKKSQMSYRIWNELAGISLNFEFFQL